MQIQLWSYNFDPEPSGIAPLSGVWARAMAALGHDVTVVAAHPHYPEPRWGRRLLPYREDRNGISVLRLPLWVGRGSAVQRVRQEASFATALALAAPTLATPDVVVAVSPSFPALLPAMVNARLRRVPWVLWLQDILPEGAIATGILEQGRLVRAARRLETAAYRSAERIVVISESFAENLRAKGVDETKLVRTYNPASRPILDEPRDPREVDPDLVLTMGNIGYTQNLVEVVRSFERSEALARRGARFVLAGDGQAGNEVRATIDTERVSVTGFLDSDGLEHHLRRAAVAVVSQRYEGIDFNVPSKLMNFMGYGLPVIASVRRDSEVARIVTESGGGWVTDSADTDRLAACLADVLDDPDELAARGAASLAFARRYFKPDDVASRFDGVLRQAVVAI
jgi:colanic acid biosynthesis glycosyl transferase WcaI